jgi:TonB-dependent starch-binding outer membrane protein SusC
MSHALRSALVTSLLSVATFTLTAHAEGRGGLAYGGVTAARPTQPSTLLARPAQLSVAEILLGDALLELEQTSGVPIAYSPGLLPRDRIVTCRCQRVTVGEALLILLADTGFQGVALADHLVIRPAMHRPVALIGTIAGRVVDAATLAPIGAAQIGISALGIGTITQSNGQYELTNVPDGSHTVQVTRIGYRDETSAVTVTPNQSVQLDFSLDGEALALDEIIVTGTPGGTQRRAIGNAVGQLEVAALAEVAPITSVRDVIGSREAGASVLGGSGAVGAGSVIRIRGSSSLSLDNGPLIYVDGVRVESGVRSGGGFPSQSSSRLDDFSPEDIESIEIIKGPAAATLYGTEAANGVIQIITKRGGAGGVTFEASARVGTHWMPNPREYFGRKWFQDPASGELVSTYLYDHESELQGYDYVGYGRNQYYHIGARGGTDVVRFSTSIDVDQEDGIFGDRHPNVNDRIASRLNLDFLASDALNVALSFAYMQRYHEHPEPGAGLGPMGNMMFGTHPLHAPQRRGFYVNKPEDVANVTTWMDGQRVVGSVAVNHAPTSWLTHRLIFGLDQGQEDRTDMFPRHPLGADGPLAARSLGERSDFSTLLTNYTGDYAATVTVPITAQIESSTSAGIQYYNRQVASANMVGRVFPAPALNTIGSAAETEASSDYLENTTLGVYIQEQLGFGNNFFVTGAVRADDNSAFGEEFDLAIYPKLSATWTFDEPLTALPWLDVIRVRSAVGAAGQQPDVFAAVRLYDPTPGPGGVSAVTPGEVGNPALKPERSEELEVGFDAALFDGRSEIEFTYYTRRTRDAIVQRSLAPSVGFPGQQWVNAGQVSNWGTELSVQNQIIRPGGWIAWDLGVTFATMRNRLDDLGIEGLTELSIPGVGARHVEGQPLASAYWRRIVSADFVSGNSGPVTNVMCEGPNGSAIPWGDDCAYVSYGGPQDPTWEANFTSDVTLFRNLRLSALVSGRGGHVNLSRDMGPRIQCCPWARVRWTQDDPILVAVAALDREQVAFFEAGHVRLQELSLTYTLPDAWIAPFGASRALFGLQMSNVAQLWRASRYTTLAEERLDGENLESFRVHEPDIRGTGNFPGSNYVQQPTKTLLASLRLSF